MVPESHELTWFKTLVEGESEVKWRFLFSPDFSNSCGCFASAALRTELLSEREERLSLRFPALSSLMLSPVRRCFEWVNVEWPIFDVTLVIEARCSPWGLSDRKWKAQNSYWQQVSRVHSRWCLWSRYHLRYSDPSYESLVELNTLNPITH